MRSEAAFEEPTVTALVSLVLLDNFCFVSLELFMTFGGLARGQKNSCLNESLSNLADLGVFSNDRFDQGVVSCGRTR